MFDGRRHDSQGSPHVRLPPGGEARAAVAAAGGAVRGADPGVLREVVRARRRLEPAARAPRPAPPPPHARRVLQVRHRRSHINIKHLLCVMKVQNRVHKL